jgi:adenylate cyclase
MERRLAAILAADVVDYSRLIGADEAGTLAGLRSLRKEVVEPILKRHHGRVVKLMGDGLLAEFASVVDAVTAAIEIQEATPGRTAHLPEDRRIALRIGVNTGDVAVEDGDLFGDGVNIAARLQEVADPNGVAISEGAHRELSGRLDLPFEDVGEKALKNIKQTVRIWLWSPLNRTKGISGSNEPSALPRKPSIAVLPFDNLSRDQQHEYLADGMTEDVITGLSQFRSLFVIARNSTFSYKGQSPDVRAVARDLGVRYILEGSVRQGGNRIRITGQLIDAETGNHI